MADIDETVALLDLLKNISHFCANYSYFSQGYIFIEKSSTSKKLHMIRMQDLKTSLRKHGVGLLPTAVNAAYMLIRNKLQTFLNFLSEDTVRFQIQRFLNELDAEKSSTDSKRKPSYKASWALILLTNLSKTVAESENGAGRTVASGTVSGSIAEEIPLTYVDKFRSIITQIGNAISLVRMLCQAARDNGYTRQDLFPKSKST
uniref:WASH-7_mid domain-containing protein n=1 Tax=Caenorhabditis japonica TaxID=281687 RepID=A0A8R1ER28_CAEJA